MLALRWFPPCVRGLESPRISRKPSSVVVCGAKGPRPRYARVWKTTRRIGTISKSAKLLQCVKDLSNVKEEVYGALDSFIAWELEFPLITVKKAIKSLEELKEWKRIIQVTKWMLSKGQGRTMGTYAILLNALAEDERLEEAEELWNKLFSDNLESTPRNLFNKMFSIYYHREMYDKMFELFADMEELGIRPSLSTVTMMGKVFQNLGMVDKYAKLKRKYPPPKWEYRYIRGKRVRIRAKDLHEHGNNRDEQSEQRDQNVIKTSPEASSDKDGDLLEDFEEPSEYRDDGEFKEVSNILDSSDSLGETEETSEDGDGVELEDLDPFPDSNAFLTEAEETSRTNQNPG